MRILGFFIGLMVLLWALLNLWPFAYMIAIKTQDVDVPAAELKFVPLALAMPWWQFVVWGLSISLFLLSGWRVLWGNRAFGIYALALILQLVNWWFHIKMPEYTQAFTAAERQLDYVIFAVEAVIGALILMIGARRRSR